jgi:hypothetical protein
VTPTPPRRALGKTPLPGGIFAKNPGRAFVPGRVRHFPAQVWVPRGLGYVGTAVDVAAKGYKYWNALEDAGYSGGEQLARTAGYTAISAAGSGVGTWAGAKAGAWAGATLGFLLGGPPGAIVGGIIFGIAGSIGGGLAGGALGDGIVAFIEGRW